MAKVIQCAKNQWDTMLPARQFLRACGLITEVVQARKVGRDTYEFSADIGSAYIIMSNVQAGVFVKGSVHVHDMQPGRDIAVVHGGLGDIEVTTVSPGVDSVMFGFGLPSELLAEKVRFNNRIFEVGPGEIREMTGLPLELSQTWVGKITDLYINRQNPTIVFAKANMVITLNNSAITSAEGLLDSQSQNGVTNVSAENGALLLLDANEQVMLRICGQGTIFSAEFYPR